MAECVRLESGCRRKATVSSNLTPTVFLILHKYRRGPADWRGRTTKTGTTLETRLGAKPDLLRGR